MTASKLDHALALAADGFWIFPCRPNGKKPAHIGWQAEATRDPAAIAHLWSVPDHNIGISTDKYGDEGMALLAVDVDVKHGIDGNSTLRGLDLVEGFKLAATREHRTPTSGRHIIYVVPKAVKQGPNVLGAGLDIRSSGGYIVAPGSVIDGKAYTVLNDAPIAAATDELVRRCGAPRPKTEKPSKGAAHFAKSPDRAIEYLRGPAPLAVSGSQSDTAYKVAARVKDFGISRLDAHGLMLDHWNERNSPPLSSDDLLNRVNNAYKYGKEEIGSAIPDFAPVAAGEAPPKRRGLYYKKFADIQRGSKVQWLVKGWLPADGISVIVGKSASGKTFLALDLALHVARGTPWNRCKVEQGGVVYVAAENPTSTERRLMAARKKLNLEGVAVPLAVVPCAVDLASQSPIYTQELVAIIRDAAADLGGQIKLVIFDTLARSMAGADENSAQAIGTVVDRLDFIGRAVGAHVAVVHHEGKDKSRGPRGSSALNAAVDTEISVMNMRATITKQRDGETGKSVNFRLEQVELGADEDGGAVFAPVVVWSDFDPVPEPPAPDTLAAKALGMLRTLIAAEGEPFPEIQNAREQIFKGDVKGVPMARWRETWVNPSQKTYATGDGNPARKSFAVVVKTLVPSHVTEKGDIVFLAAA